MPTLGELASRLELEFLGDSAMPIKGIASLDTAGPEHLSFVSEKKHLRRVADTRAGALILHPDWVDRWSGGALLSPAPYVAYAHVSRISITIPLRPVGCTRRPRSQKARSSVRALPWMSVPAWRQALCWGIVSGLEPGPMWGMAQKSEMTPRSNPVR